jgi:hypothetical protein
MRKNPDGIFPSVVDMVRAVGNFKTAKKLPNKERKCPYRAR